MGKHSYASNSYSLLYPYVSGGFNMNTTLYYNGKIYTLERENECFDSMLVSDGMIAGLYMNKPKLNEKVMEVNLEGKAMIPTFSDAHMHFVFSSFLIGMGLSIS